MPDNRWRHRVSTRSLSESRSTSARSSSTHHGHQPEIELTGDDEATGIWAMEDVLVWPADGYRLRGTGHYWETYRKVDGEWKIASMKLTRLYVFVERIDPVS